MLMTDHEGDLQKDADKLSGTEAVTIARIFHLRIKDVDADVLSVIKA